MSDHLIPAGSPTPTINVGIRNGSTGLLQTGLTASSLACTYNRAAAGSAVTVTLVAGTLGSYAPGAIVETSTAGLYQFCPPVAAVASGAAEADFVFKGTGVIDAKEHCILTGQAGSLGLVGQQLPAYNVGSPGGLLTSGTGPGQINPDGTGSVPIAFGTALPSTPAPNTIGESLYVADAQRGRTGTAQAGTTTTITLDAGASSDTGAYVGDDLFLTGGTGGGLPGTGQRRTVIGYNPTTKVATVNRAWDTVPTSTTTFVTLPGQGTPFNASSDSANALAAYGLVAATNTATGAIATSVGSLATTVNASNAAIGSIATGATVVRANTSSGAAIVPVSALPANFGTLVLSSGQTVSTYSGGAVPASNLPTFPTNFAAMQISSGGEVTAAVPTGGVADLTPARLGKLDSLTFTNGSSGSLVQSDTRYVNGSPAQQTTATVPNGSGPLATTILVTDAASGSPIIGATVFVIQAGVATPPTGTTLVGGSVTLNLVAGAGMAVVYASGYAGAAQSLTVTGTGTTVGVGLAAKTVAIPAQAVRDAMELTASGAAVNHSSASIAHASDLSVSVYPQVGVTNPTPGSIEATQARTATIS